MALKDELTALIDAQQESAAQLVRDFQESARQAELTLNYYFLPQYPPPTDGVIGNAYEPVTGINLPNLNDLQPGEFPERPNFLTPDDILTNPLELLEDQPELDLDGLFQQRIPAELGVDAPEPPAIDTTLAVPAAPTIEDITIPNLIDVNIPTPPDVPEIPEFSTNRPTLEYNIEDLGDVFQEGLQQGLDLINQYASERTSAVVDKYYPKVSEQTSLVDDYLCEFVQGNIRAIPAVVWDQIYNRFQARNDSQAARAADIAAQDHKRMGLPYMADDVRASFYKAQADAMQANYDANIAVIEQEATREFQQMQFTLTMLHDVRKSCANLWVDVFQRTVITQVETAIRLGSELVRAHAETYNQYIRKFEAEVRLYLADAQVWEIRAKYVFIHLELYKELLNAARLESEVNTQLLRQTEQRIALDERYLRRYALQIEALRATIEVEELKIRIYEAQIRAFQVQVAAKDSEINLYRAQIQGDQAKIQGELAKLEAYNSQLATIRAYIDAQIAYNQNKQTYNRVLIDTRDSDIRTILANFEQERATEQNKIEVFRAQIDQLRALLQQALDSYRTQHETARANANISLENARIQTNQQEINMRVINEQRRNLGNAYLSSAKVNADVAAAVNAGINQFINVGAQEITNVEG